MVSLTRTAAQALARQRITSNCICPGAVDTAMWEQIDREWGALEGWRRGRPGSAAPPASRSAAPRRPTTWRALVVFLAGPDSDYMTGQAINVDGGLVMGG